MTTLEDYFITYLESLAEDRAALAALRRGLGQSPGHTPEMHPYVIRFLPKNAYPNSWVEQSYYLIASLYGLHPEVGKGENLGHHFACTLVADQEQNKAVERRFTALLTAHPDDLAAYLRQAVSYLKAKEVNINWHQLMNDVLRWGNPDWQPEVQKRWARYFWNPPKEDEKKETEVAATETAR